MASGRPDWNRIVTIQGSGNREVLVDSAGKLLSVMQGQDGEDLRTLFVDGSGKMVTRIQAATGGDLVVYVLDDCGDTESIDNWVEDKDGLDPVESTTFVREGSKAMKLGVDASLDVADYAAWVSTITEADLTGLNNDKIKLWVYLSSKDYLLDSNYAIKYIVGSDTSNTSIYWFSLASLSQGWNELVCDLANPDETLGTIDWSAITIQSIRVYELVDNTNDFYLVVDSIVVVRDNLDPGIMKDVNTDKDGFLLSKMVGSFGDHLKALQTDRHGNLRINLTEGGASAASTDPKYSSMLYAVGTASGSIPSIIEIFDKSGPGVITAGYLRHKPNVTNKTSYYRFIIDGYTFTLPLFSDEDLWSVYTKDMDLIHLIKYDDTNFEYIHAFCSWIYWKTRIQIFVSCTTAPIVSSYRIVYSLF